MEDLSPQVARGRRNRSGRQRGRISPATQWANRQLFALPVGGRDAIIRTLFDPPTRKTREMRRTCFGLLLLIAAVPGCARWASFVGSGESPETYNGISRQWLTTDSDAQSRTDTLIEQSQSDAKQRVARQPADPAKTQSTDQELSADSPSEK